MLATRWALIVGAASAVWPVPRSTSHDGEMVSLDATQFRFEADCDDGVLTRALARYEGIMRRAAAGADAAPSTSSAREE